MSGAVARTVISRLAGSPARSRPAGLPSRSSSRTPSIVAAPVPIRPPPCASFAFSRRSPSSAATRSRYRATVSPAGPSAAIRPRSSQRTRRHRARDQRKVMGHEDERLAGALEIREPLERPMGESFIADRQHLVDEKHVGVARRRDGEAQPHGHARRVRLDGRVEELLDARKAHDLIEARGDLLARQSQQQPRDLDVLAPRDLGMESGAQLEQRGEPSPHLDGAPRRADDPRQELQQRRLAGAVGADDPERLARGDLEGDFRQRRDALPRLPSGSRRATRT